MSLFATGEKYALRHVHSGPQSTPDNPAGSNSLSERSRDKRGRYRLYGKADKIARSFLKRIQGALCVSPGCQEQWTDVHHNDGDVTNYDATNLSGMCGPHNQAAYNRLRKLKSEGVKEREREKELVTTTVDSVPWGSREGKKNAEVEPAFRSWVIGKLAFNGGGPFPWDWFVVNGAEIFRVMQVTTTRYMEKLTAESGPLAVYEAEVDKRVKRLVKFKPEFWQQQPQSARLAHLNTLTDEELLHRIHGLSLQPESELERVEANMVLTARRLERAQGVRDLE